MEKWYHVKTIVKIKTKNVSFNIDRFITVEDVTYVNTEDPLYLRVHDSYGMEMLIKHDEIEWFKVVQLNEEEE